jgi:hypothetical protein
MNNIAVLPYICLHALQIQNVKRDIVKKVSINELNQENIGINNKEIVCPVDQEDIQTNANLEKHHVEDTSINKDLTLANQDWSSTNIDDLPQPMLSDSNQVWPSANIRTEI